MLRPLLCRNGYMRGKYLKKKRVFECQGEHCFFSVCNIGTEPYLISIGDNVHVASQVTFINHDVMDKMYSYMCPDMVFHKKKGRITIGNNVFIGAGSLILYDVKIGDNVVIAAGSVVTADIPEGTVAGGVPARRIGDFYDLMEKRREEQDGAE